MLRTPTKLFRCWRRCGVSSAISLRDYSQSRAVLVGTWKYEYRQDVPAVENSYMRMASILNGPHCEWPAESIYHFTNEPGNGDLPDKLVTTFHEATDVALFYYVGHGLMDTSNELCLSLSGTRAESHRVATTSL